MNNFIQMVTPDAWVIANHRTWLEQKALDQLITVSQLPGMIRAIGMPDLHPGRDSPVGAVFASDNRVYPALIGNDIGCGMALWQTELALHKIKLDKLSRKIGDIDQHDPAWQGWAESQGLPTDLLQSFSHCLGTIGGGNHFAELQKVDQVLDLERFNACGLSTRQLLLMVHSGSRGLGQQILSQHLSEFGHQGLETNSQAFEHYRSQHQQALEFARVNRQVIAHRLMERLGTDGHRVTDRHHNLLTRENIDGRSLWLHRKGATPASAGLALVPGSRGDYSYLVATTAQSQAMNSLAHGAGRRWSRSQCKARLDRRYTPEQLRRTELGSQVVCDDRALLYEEAPQAYKSIEDTITVMQEAGMLTPIARLRPMLTYKTREARRC